MGLGSESSRDTPIEAAGRKRPFRCFDGRTATRSRRVVWRDGRRSRLIARIDRLLLPSEPGRAERLYDRALQPRAALGASGAMVMSALGLAALDDPTWGPLTGALAAASMATAWVIVWLAVAAWSARQEPRSRPPALEVDARGIQVGGRFTAWHDISGWTEQDGGITFFDGTLRRVRTPRLRPAERAIFTTLAASRVGSPRELPPELETLRARVSA